MQSECKGKLELGYLPCNIEQIARALARTETEVSIGFLTSRQLHRTRDRQTDRQTDRDRDYCLFLFFASDKVHNNEVKSAMERERGEGERQRQTERETDRQTQTRRKGKL